MKKSIFATFAAAAVLSGTAFAGGIENKTNMSTGYLRNPSRNTESRRPEAAFYNIAGTGFMADGIYFEAGNQFVFKEYKNTISENELLPINTQINLINGASGQNIPLISALESNDKTIVWLYPDADIVFKKGPFAAFLNFGIYAGGGNLEYSEGTTATQLLFTGKAAANLENNINAAKIMISAANNHSVSISSITYGEQLGASYNIKNIVSVSAAIRFLEGSQSMKLKSNALNLMGNNSDSISYSASAFGLGGVFGVHIIPISGLDISAQYQTISKLEYEVNEVNGSLASAFGISDGKKFNTDLPSVLNAGIGYQVIEPLYISTSFNYYFNKYAHQDTILGKTDYDNSFEITAGADYDICEQVTAGLGVSYAKQGTTESSNSTFNPVLDSLSIGGGAEYKPVDNLAITLGLMYVKYFDKDYKISQFTTELSKKIFMFSLGATYRLPI